MNLELHRRPRPGGIGRQLANGAASRLRSKLPDLLLRDRNCGAA